MYTHGASSAASKILGERRQTKATELSSRYQILFVA
jgi:hypothetical protein